MEPYSVRERNVFVLVEEKQKVSLYVSMFPPHRYCKMFLHYSIGFYISTKGGLCDDTAGR